MILARHGYTVLFVLLLILCPGPTRGTSQPALGGDAPVPWIGDFADGWRQFDKLLEQQKHEAASALAGQLLEKAIEENNSTEWTRGLVRQASLRIGLHGYETAVRGLKEQPWPRDLAGRSVLGLYYAHSLAVYARVYSWEINRRETVESAGPVDLKAWTRERIYQEAHAACEAVWGERGRLGEHSNADWADFIVPNTYPEGIRPTLRDAVAYMWVALLEDTNGWGPEQLNEIHKLDLRRLAGGGPEAVALADAAVHPLEKIRCILADLEAWHLSLGNREAALEARLELSRQLHRHFVEPGDREYVRAGLQALLAPLGDLPWWSEGMAQLAEFTREAESADNLIRARAIALEGERTHPESHGARHCRAIVGSIEAPEYFLGGMQTDGPGRRSIELRHKNLPAVHFRAYAIDLLETVLESDDYSLLPTGRTLEAITRRPPTLSWEEPLPATADFKSHWTHITPPMTSPGTYLITASARAGFPEEDNQIRGMYLTVSDLVVVARSKADGLEVTVLSGSGGGPEASVEVTLYRKDWRRGHRKVAAARTDSRGIARFDGFDDIGQGESTFLVARKGGQTALGPEQADPRRDPPQREEASTLLYTDRSIYRPGQKILWKAVAYGGRGGDLRTAPSATLTVTLRDPNGQEVASKTVVTNTYGTASGEFLIPPGRMLGGWYMESSRGGGNRPVRVEEYKRPTFEAELEDPPEPLRLNREAVIRGAARYYFGLPVTGATARWRVLREPVYPLRWGSPGSRGVPRIPDSRPQAVASGTASLGPDGSFSFAFLPEADERLAAHRDVTYRYAVSVDVTDEGGETRSAGRSFELGFISVRAAWVIDREFFMENEPLSIDILRTSLDGAGRSGRGQWRIVSLRQPGKTLLPADQPVAPPGEPGPEEAYQTPGDRVRRRSSPGYDHREILGWWPDGPAAASGSVEHDAAGAGALAHEGLGAGAYRLIYRTEDDFGETFELRREFVVASRSMTLPLPALFSLEKPSVAVGETARLLVHSGLADQLMVLETYRDGACIRRQEIVSGSDPSLVEIPVTEDDRGGLGLTVTMVRDHQILVFQQGLWVPWDNKELDVEFSTFRDRLRPGSRETWSVRVSAPAAGDAAAVSAELLAYMYDRSLDAFVPHWSPSPIGQFPSRTRWADARSSLGPARGVYIRSMGFTRPAATGYLPDRLLDYGGYAAGGPGGRVARMSLRMAHDKAAEVGMMPSPSEDLSLAVADQEYAADGLERRQDAPVEAPAPISLRSDFGETAFWRPHLTTGPDGSASFEFDVPDSVTSWNVWVHALTRDLKSGSARREARSVKDLMVRPYLPRFLREGDRAEIKVVVNNASDLPLDGQLDLDILDPATEQSILADFGLSRADASGRPFAVEAGGGVNLTFPVRAPSRVGPVAFRVTARSGGFTDGELRPLPILPGRMHLAQSRFAALRDKDRRVLVFEDLERDDDPTRINEQMVVTLDAQLFYSVLSALPYLADYPYECTEQTLNRFLSTGILSSLYARYPAVAKMAREFSSRETLYERWDDPDPNRTMMLEETPWLEEARGGPDDAGDPIRVLDSRVALALRAASIEKLGASQTASGGFPWFAGGAPSPYMTLYILNGFSRALEFGVDVPRDMIGRAWGYTHRHYLDDIVRDMVERGGNFEFVTYINYVLSSYPDGSWYEGSFTPAERRAMLDASFRSWRGHSPYLKGCLALTLLRAGRADDARLVWASVMDAAKTAPDEGTFWAPEDRAWLWYNDTIETHAFALRTEMELAPGSPKLDGLVQWLFLNKKLNHWKSTRATSEVVYSLAEYLEATGQLGVREDATVTVGNRTTSFVFEPDAYTGRKNRVVIPGDGLGPKPASTVTVEKTGRGLMFASATWHFSTEVLPAEERGDTLGLTRSYFKRVRDGADVTLQPLGEGAALEPGDEVEVRLSLRSRHPMEYIHLRDPRGAGFEPASNVSRHKWDLGIGWYEEIRDSGTNFFFERLPQGEYTFRYRIRAATAGTFRVAPATVQPMYAPEFAAISAGAELVIGGAAAGAAAGGLP